MSSASAAAGKAQDSRALEGAARVGYVVLGLLHLLIGVIAVSIATGSGGDSADQSGALQQVRDAPLGTALLWAIVVGLAALAVWQIAEAIVERDPDAKKRWAHRAKFVGTAVAYIAIAATAFTLATGGSSESAESSKTLSAQILAMPGGVALLVVVGLGVAVIGVAFIVRGLTRAFEKHMSIPGGTAGRGIRAFGMVGYVAKGIAVGVAGSSSSSRRSPMIRTQRAGSMRLCARSRACRSVRWCSGSWAPAWWCTACSASPGRATRTCDESPPGSLGATPRPDACVGILTAHLRGASTGGLRSALKMVDAEQVLAQRARGTEAEPPGQEIVVEQIVALRRPGGSRAGDTDVADAMGG